jgi:hypothetical protein
VVVIQGVTVVMRLLRVSSLGSVREPRISTKKLVVVLDRQFLECMEEGSGHGPLSWAGHHCTGH